MIVVVGKYDKELKNLRIMVITAKQKADRKVTQTVFIPLSRAIELEKEAKRLGVSRNRLINSYIDFDMQHKNEVKIVEYDDDDRRRRTTTTTQNPSAHVSK
jgi:hypothetical protein